MAECACIALSVERKISDIVDVVNFDIHPEVIEHRKMSNPHWNGTHFRVPETGIYHISWGFFRDGTVSLSDDDISLHLMKSPVTGIQDKLIATAFAGEDHANGNGRKSGHHVVIIELIKNEDLYLKSHIDGNKHGHMRDIYFTLFKICCNSSIEIGGGC